MVREAQQQVGKWSEFQLFDANHRLIDVVGVVLLFVQVGNCRVKAELIVCQILALPILIGTDFTNKYVYAIYYMEDKLTMKKSDTVPILGRIPR